MSIFSIENDFVDHFLDFRHRIENKIALPCTRTYLLFMIMYNKTCVIAIYLLFLCQYQSSDVFENFSVRYTERLIRKSVATRVHGTNRIPKSSSRAKSTTFAIPSITIWPTQRPWIVTTPGILLFGNSIL